MKVKCSDAIILFLYVFKPHNYVNNYFKLGKKRRSTEHCQPSRVREALLYCTPNVYKRKKIIIKNTPFCPLEFFVILLIVTDGNHKRMPCAGLKQIHTGIYSITQYLLKQSEKYRV